MSRGASFKRQCINMILELIRKEPGIGLKKLQAIMGVKVGLNPRRVSQYLEQLSIAGEIEEREGGFYIRKR